MTFASFTFLVFLTLSFGGSRIWRPHEKSGRLWLFLVSLVFYGWWYPPYLILLFLNGYVDYWCSLRMPGSPRRRFLLALSLSLNLGMLAYFKYAGFFAREAGAWFFPGFLPPYLDVILPIGISFYTFQSMSYTIDVYRGHLKPEKSVVDYFMYLAFFPQLVAGPIVRAVDFLPQIGRRLDLSFGDWRFIAYRLARGFFLKLVIADNVSPYVDRIFARDPSTLGFWDSWLGAMLFSVQIFADFAGYSDIAIGCARMFGFKLLENFRNPFAAVGFEDFWRRWHISLSTWFRDYVYVPLGGNRRGGFRTELNVAVVFLLSGLWHGANWTFILWGGLHGLALIAQKRIRSAFPARRPGNAALKFLAFAGTFVAVEFLWVPFRSPNVGHAASMWKKMLGFSSSGTSDILASHAEPIGFFLAIFAAFAVLQFVKERLGRPDGLRVGYAESLVYFALILTVAGTGTDFIYFQF